MKTRKTSKHNCEGLLLYYVSGYCSLKKSIVCSVTNVNVHQSKGTVSLQAKVMQYTLQMSTSELPCHYTYPFDVQPGKLHPHSLKGGGTNCIEYIVFSLADKLDR